MNGREVDEENIRVGGGGVKAQYRKGKKDENEEMNRHIWSRERERGERKRGGERGGEERGIANGCKRFFITKKSAIVSTL